MAPIDAPIFRDLAGRQRVVVVAMRRRMGDSLLAARGPFPMSADRKVDLYPMDLPTKAAVLGSFTARLGGTARLDHQ